MQENFSLVILAIIVISLSPGWSVPALGPAQ